MRMFILSSLTCKKCERLIMSNFGKNVEEKTWYKCELMQHLKDKVLNAYNPWPSNSPYRNSPTKTLAPGISGFRYKEMTKISNSNEMVKFIMVYIYVCVWLYIYIIIAMEFCVAVKITELDLYVQIWKEVHNIYSFSSFLRNNLCFEFSA